MALAQTLVDTFPGTILNPQWTAPLGSPSVAGGQCLLPCTSGYSAIGSAVTLNLTGSYAFCNIIPDQVANDGQTYIDARIDANNYVQLGYSAAVSFYYVQVAGAQAANASITYDTVNHTWYRLRETGGSLYFDTSPNGFTWTNQWNTPDPWAVTALTIGARSGYYGTGPAGSSYVRWFNVQPPYAVRQGLPQAVVTAATR